VLEGVRVTGTDRKAGGAVDWRKSTYSTGNGGACVEVAGDGVVMVRDTTDRDGGTLAFSAAAWERFLGTIR
jgi:Domain of unknown function (DUF397)